MNFFTKAFEEMPEEAKESFYKTVFLNDTSEYAREKRQEYYRAVLKSMGNNVRIGAGVKIVNPQLISIGDDCIIGDNTTIIARPGSEIILGNHVRLQQRVYLDTERKTGYIHIGDEVYIGTGTTLFAHVGLEIGDHTLMAQNITLTPYSPALALFRCSDPG